MWQNRVKRVSIIVDFLLFIVDDSFNPVTETIKIATKTTSAKFDVRGTRSAIKSVYRYSTE